MFVPNNKRSSESLLDLYGAYLEAQLKADTETVRLFGILEKASAALVVINDHERKARRGIQVSLAARNLADFRMDRMVSQLRSAVLSQLDSHRARAMVSQLFPKGVGVLQKQAWMHQMEKLRVIEAALSDPTLPDGLKAWKPKIAAGRELVEKTFAMWQESLVAHGNAVRDELTGRTMWIGSYLTIHAELVKLFPTDRRRVESYFRPGPHHIKLDAVVSSSAVLPGAMRSGKATEDKPASGDTKIIEPPEAGEGAVA